MIRAEVLATATAQLQTAGIAPADARNEAAILLRHITGATREELFLRPDALLFPAEADRYNIAVSRRAAREPLAYIIGTRDFYGLTFTVTPAVLVPRPETEGVVEEGVGCLVSGTGAESLPGAERLPQNLTPDTQHPTLLDLCTGSGAIAVAVAVHAPHAHITATDISADALAVARANANRHGVADRITLLAGDLFAPIVPGTLFDCIAANPPYIAPADIETLEPEVREWEPRIALGVHADALHFYRRIAAESGAFLAEGGRVVVEVGQGQAGAVCALFRAAGFADVESFPDLAGIPRVVVAKGLPRR